MGADVELLPWQPAPVRPVRLLPIARARVSRRRRPGPTGSVAPDERERSLRVGHRPAAYEALFAAGAAGAGGVTVEVQNPHRVALIEIWLSHIGHAHMVAAAFFAFRAW